MGRTLRDITNDIQVLLRQSADDREFEDIHVAWACTIIGDRLRSQHIQKRDSGAFLSVYANVPVSQFTTISNPNQIPNRDYLELPACIYDFNLDAGIEYISYWDNEDDCGSQKFKNVKFNRTSPSKVESLYYSEYTKPSPSNPYFYRVDKYIYLLGLECVDIDAVEMGIYAILPHPKDVDIDAEWPFPAELLPVLQRHVLDILRLGLQMPDDGKLNTGDDNSTPQEVPNQKLISVNDPVVSSEGSNQ